MITKQARTVTRPADLDVLVTPIKVWGSLFGKSWKTGPKKNPATGRFPVDRHDFWPEFWHDFWPDIDFHHARRALPK